MLYLDGEREEKQLYMVEKTEWKQLKGAINNYMFDIKLCTSFWLWKLVVIFTVFLSNELVRGMVV